MRTGWWRANGPDSRWSKCVVGSGLAHAALLGVCLLIRPASDHMRPVLRVRLVEEASAPTLNPVAAEPLPAPAPVKAVTPSPSKLRRIPPAPLPSVVQTAPVAVPAAEAVPTPAPATESVRQTPTPAMHSEPNTPEPPPSSTPIPPPVVPATALPPGPPAGESAVDAFDSRGAGEESRLGRMGGGSGSAAPSQAVESEARGVFLVAGQGSGTGAGSGTGNGPGSGRGQGSGVGRGEGTGVGGNDSNGAHTIAGRGEGAPSNGASLGDLLRAIRSQIERARVYPDTARRQGLQGTVEIRFRIGRDGSVAAVEIVRSSGHELLDQVSSDTVRRAGPYPLVPGWIRIPLAYRLDQ